MVYFAAESLVYFGAEWWCSIVRNMQLTDQDFIVVFYDGTGYVKHNALNIVKFGVDTMCPFDVLGKNSCEIGK